MIKGGEENDGDGDMEVEELNMSVENEGVLEGGDMADVVADVGTAEPTGLAENEIT